MSPAKVFIICTAIAAPLDLVRLGMMIGAVLAWKIYKRRKHYG